MTKPYSLKTVFALIDLANNVEEQKNVAKYAAKLANALDIPLVLYPQRDGKSPVLNFRKAVNTARKYATTEISISKFKINPFTMFTSLQDVAKQEKAAFIIMGANKKSVLFFGKTIWSTTQKNIIPTILLPQGIEFTPYKRITIAVDKERKMQKLKKLHRLAKAFDSEVKIFVENAKDNDQKFTLYQVTQNVIAYLEKAGIPSETIHARQIKNFPKHICKYTAKNADLLIIEVDPGKIPSVVKQNIDTLLDLSHDPATSKAAPKPVMLTKTKETGRYGTFR